MTHENIAQNLAERVNRIKPSPTLAVSARTEQLQAAGKPIINLGVGEPDFDTPEYIKEAAIAAIQAGKTKYTVVDGMLALRQAICDKLARDNHLKYEPNQILVSNGAKHSIYNLFAAVINPCDEVIIPAPYWVSYPDMVKLTDGQPVIINCDIQHQFKLTPQALESAITPNTRLLMLNSPSNPTGVAYTKEEWLALGAVLLKHPNIIIASDDIYEQNLWHHTPFTNILNATPELYDRTVIINGVSKSYAMTGWRIGYAAGPLHLINAMKKVQSQTTSNASSISQYASLAALTGDQSAIKMMTEAYKERHDYLVSELQKIPGFECIPSDGTFYTFPKVTQLITRLGLQDDIELADFLLDQAEVAVVPGSAFGAPGYLRFSFATSMDNLKLAISRLNTALK